MAQEGKNLGRQLKSAEKKVYLASVQLSMALERLGVLASSIYGEELNADLCNGEEIEFRHPGDELGEVILMEDLILMCNEKKGE